MFETSARRTATSPRFSAILVNGSLLLRDWTLLPTSSYSKVSGVGRPHGIGFVAYLFFSTLESGFKKFRIRCQIRRIRVDESRIRKEKVADSKNSVSVWTGPQYHSLYSFVPMYPYARACTLELAELINLKVVLLLENESFSKQNALAKVY